MTAAVEIHVAGLCAAQIGFGDGEIAVAGVIRHGVAVVLGACSLHDVDIVVDGVETDGLVFGVRVLERDAAESACPFSKER